MGEKKMTREEFYACLENINLSQRTREIAEGVLVHGLPQTFYVNQYQLTKGAVSQAVSRVWEAYLDYKIPDSHEKVVAVLPKHKAHIVRQWEKIANQTNNDHDIDR